MFSRREGVGFCEYFAIEVTMLHLMGFQRDLFVVHILYHRWRPKIAQKIDQALLMISHHLYINVINLIVSLIIYQTEPVIRVFS